MITNSLRWIAMAVIAIMVAGSAAKAQVIEVLNDFGNGAVAHDVSADGSVVVGSVTTANGVKAARWVNGVLEVLPDYGYAGSVAYAVSADGSIAVGRVFRTPQCCTGEAVRWQGDQFVGLWTSYNVGDCLVGCGTGALGLSRSGSIAVGVYPIAVPNCPTQGYSDIEAPYVAGQVLCVPNPFDFCNSGCLGGAAFDVSDDGSVIVGTLYALQGVVIGAVRWDNGAWMVLDGAESAVAVSADGRIAVGGGVWWDEAGLPHPLSTLGGAVSANDVSADGLVVAGSAHDPATGFDQAVLWTNGNAPRVLPGLGGAASVNALNPDGSVLAGRAYEAKTGKTRAVRWVLPSSPFCLDAPEGECVYVPRDFPTIQDAISSASASVQRTIVVAPGTHVGSIDLQGKRVHIRGTGLRSTIIEGTPGLGVSVVRASNEPAGARIDGVTIRGGMTGTPLPGAGDVRVGGGVFADQSALVLSNCEIVGNASGYGGGAYFRNCTGSIVNCSVRDNSAAQDGGGIQISGGSVTVEDTLVSQNESANRGGGMHVTNGGAHTLRRVMVTGNESVAAAGVSFVHLAALGDSPSQLQVVDCGVEGNVAEQSEGGLGIYDETPAEANVFVRGTRMCANTPRPNAAGLWTDEGGNEICDCRADSNADGRVDGADLAALLAEWGPSSATTSSDFDRSGIVDAVDLSLLLALWGCEDGTVLSLNAVSPVAGPTLGGTAITLTGTNLLGTTAVTVGGIPATDVKAVSTTTVTAITPPGTAGPADVTVVTPGGTASLSSVFTYVTPPVLESLSPATGPATPGTTITLTGVHLTGTTSVTVGGAATTNVQVVSDTTVTARTAALPIGPCDVILTTPGGTATLVGGYVSVPRPNLDSVSPDSGSTVGGTTVTLTGSNLLGTSAVRIGTTSATDVQVVSENTVTARTPPIAAGVYSVSLSAVGGTATLAGAFAVDEPPRLTAVLPRSGPMSGGTFITLTGSNLLSANSVRIGGVLATDVTVVDASTVTALVPPGALGARDVSVSTQYGFASLAAAFTYISSPTITSTAPSGGATVGGTTVTVSGTGLLGTTALYVGGLPATNLQVISSSLVRAVTPPLSVGVYDITVSGSGGSAVARAAFEIEEISPSRVTGTAVLEGAVPVPGAVARSPFGAFAYSDQAGQFELEAYLPTGTSSLPIEVSAMVSGVLMTGMVVVEDTVPGDTYAAGHVLLSRSSQGCDSDVGWEGMFGGSGFNGTVYAFATLDDGDGSRLYAAGLFSYFAGRPLSRVASWDGTAWHPLGEGLNDSVRALAVYDDGNGPALYAGGSFTEAGGEPASRIAKWDGSAWHPLGEGLNGSVLALAVYDDGNGPALYAGGSFTEAGGEPASRIAKWDGSAWHPLGEGLNGSVLALAVYDDGSGPALYAGGSFTEAGGEPASRIAKWDGSAWSALGSGVDSSVDALAVFSSSSTSHLYVKGALGGLGRWDGSHWSPAGVIAGSGSPRAMTVFDDGTGPALYAVGVFTVDGGVRVNNNVARWDGTRWSALSAGYNEAGWGFGGGFALCLHGHDDGAGRSLLVGGLFTSAQGVASHRIARWRIDEQSGGVWSGVGQSVDLGINNRAGAGDPAVLAMCNHDDGTGPSLFLGGYFGFAGGVPANNIVRWDGAEWRSLGDGLNGTVRAMAVHDDGTGRALYVAGDFTQAGGVPANRVARWNGSSWSAVGSGVESGSVNALLSYDDGQGSALYIGGQFTQLGGQSVSRVAKWSGGTWSALGSGVPGTVYALAAFDDGDGTVLYAGGQMAGGVRRWDGTSWSTPGIGIPGGVQALAVHNDGTGPALFVGGQFSSAGGIPAFGLAKWNGKVWSALGAGSSAGGPSSISRISSFQSLEQPEGSVLCIGGSFNAYSGSPNLLRWDGSTFAGFGGSPGTVSGGFQVAVGVYSLGVFDDGRGPSLIIGGNFTGSPSGDSFLAKWGCVDR
jgi:uncharacterized membrane protein